MRSINELHTDTRILINYLEKELIKAGRDEVTYAELSAAIGRDIRLTARGLLKTARKRIEQDYNITIEPIIGVGIKKTCDYKGILDKSSNSIGRKARKSARRVLNAVSASDVSGEPLTAISSRLSMMAAISMMSKSSTAKRIEAKVAEHGNKELPLQQTLDFFAKKA